MSVTKPSLAQRVYPLIAGKLTVDSDGVLDLQMPGVERYGLQFAVRVRDAVEVVLRVLLEDE